jgi:hypothetical protein
MFEQSVWPFPADDLYPAYAAARERAPVQWHEGMGAHLILSHELAAQVLRDPEWSSDPQNDTQMLAALGGGPMAGVWSRSMLMSDPPTHTRLRGAVNRFFTPRAVHAIGERVAAIVESAVEPLRDGEPVELMESLAYPIPLAVIAELFDVGLEGAELLRSETPKLARMLELEASEQELEEGMSAAITLMLFLVPILSERTSNPGEDLLSVLAHAPEDGEELATDEIVTMCLLLLAAGHETTANLIGNGTLALLENPEQMIWLREHPEHISQAVDELLRYDSPVQIARRAALHDLTLAGSTVGKGEQALVLLGAANRDPAQHERPDRLDLSRTPSRSLAFGLGPHFCVGAGLARLEAQLTFLLLPKLGWTEQQVAWTAPRDPTARVFRRLSELHVAAHSFA